MTNRNKAVLWVLAVFLLGAMSGGTLVYLLILPDSTSPAASKPGRGRESHPDAMKRLAKDLNLDEKQQAQVDQIFQDARKKSHEAFKVIRTGIHDQLKQVLRPEQLAKFDKVMRERRPPGGDRGGPPPRDDDQPQR